MGLSKPNVVWSILLLVRKGVNDVLPEREKYKRNHPFKKMYSLNIPPRGCNSLVGYVLVMHLALLINLLATNYKV